MSEILSDVGIEQNQENPVEENIEVFQERAFCIVGDEMKAKMDALGLNEEDILKISYGDKNHEILEHIDIHFSQVQELEQLLRAKYDEEYAGYRDSMTREEIKKGVNDETIHGLKNRLSWVLGLQVLFSKYPGKIKEIYEKRYWANFMHLLRYSSEGEKYQFDFDGAIEFFELAEKIERERKGGEDRFDMFDELCDAYENLYEKIKNPELFNDMLKISVKSGNRCKSFLNIIRYLNKNESDVIQEKYQFFIGLAMASGRNSCLIFERCIRIYYVVSCFEKKYNHPGFLKGLECFGEDIPYILGHDDYSRYINGMHGGNNFLSTMLEKSPERFVENCMNLKKLADTTGKNEVFYTLSLKEITPFIMQHADSWGFLQKSAEILGKYSCNVMGTGIRFMRVLYTRFPGEYEEILKKTLEIGKKSSDSDTLFMSSGLDFLAEYLEKDGEKIFFEMAEKMVALSNKYLNEENNGVFYSQKENPLTYGLGFIKIYCEYFPLKYDEIIERVMKLIASYGDGSHLDKKYNYWGPYFLGIYHFINGDVIKSNPGVLDNLLDFFEEIMNVKKNIELVFALGGTDFSETDKNVISNTCVQLFQNNRDKIIPFIKLLFIMDDLRLSVNLSSTLSGEINDEKLANLEKMVREKLESKKSFKDDKKDAIYDETVQEAFGERIDERMSGFEQISEEKRKRNIKKVNKKQLSQLFGYGIEHEKYDKTHRTLVLYFRAENMDTFQFSLITHILYRYVNGGYSKVFDRILVTSRGQDQYPHEIHNIGDIPYQYHDFKEMSTIFANIIHFTHGTAIEKGFEFMGTAIPILGIANLAHEHDTKKIRVPENSSFTPLHLLYFKNDLGFTKQHHEMDKSGKFEDLFDEIIRAVQACEEMMIK